MDLEDSSLSFQSSLSVQEGRLNMCQSSPSVQGGRLNMRQSSPSVQGGRLNKCQSSPSVQGGRLNMCQSSPSIQEGRLNMRQSSPSVQGGVLNMRQSSPCVQGGGINMRQSSPSVQSGGLNMRQSSPSVQSGGLNMRQSSPIVQGGGLNMRQSSPSVQGGELNMCQSSPSVQGGGLNMRQSSPSVQGGGLNMRNTGFLEHQIVGTVVRDGTEYTDINSSGRDCRLKSHLRASNKEKRLRSVSESGRSPGSTGSPGSSGSSGDWSTLEARNFSRTSSGIFCRICHDADGAEALISPCQCSGSVALVHRTCIEKWLSTVNNDTCELCHHKYMISRHPRPFVTWLCAPSVEDDQRNLVGDIVCFILLTPLAGISTYLCASGASFYLKEKKSESIGLICLSVVLVSIYILWFVLTLKYHLQIWYVWRSTNQDIRLMEFGRDPIPTNEWRNHHAGPQNQTSNESTSPVKVVDISNNSYVNISQLYSETHQKYDRNQNSASYLDQNLKEKGYKLNFLETSRKMLNSSKTQTIGEIQKINCPSTKTPSGQEPTNTLAKMLSPKYLSSFGDHVNYGRDPRLSNTPTWKPALSAVSDEKSETANNSQLISDSGHFESTVGGHFVPAEESPQLISTTYLPNKPGKPLSPTVKTVTSTPSPNSKPYLRNDGVIYAEYVAKPSEKIKDVEITEDDLDKNEDEKEDDREDEREDELAKMSIAQRRKILENAFIKPRREIRRRASCEDREEINPAEENSSPWHGNKPFLLPGIQIRQGDQVGRHEDHVGRHKDHVHRHEDHVRRHEDHVCRHEDHVGRHEDQMGRHEDHVHQHEDHVGRHEDQVGGYAE